MSKKPVLRPLDFQPVLYQDREMWLLRDPMRLAEQQLLLPAPLAQLLTYLDGKRDLAEIREAFQQDVGQDIEPDIIRYTLQQLDEACLLENDRSHRAKAEQLRAYHAQPHRPPALADVTYPADRRDLSHLFNRYARNDNLNGWQPWRGRAIISPHIDYQRGGPVYARVWRRAATAIAEAELVLIFGTDHNGGLGSVTLTQQAYATPFGVLPMAPDLVQALAEALGPEKAYDLELNHREEHSVELSAVWLHYMYRQLGLSPAPMVPILCGTFQHFVSDGYHPRDDAALNAFVETLQRRTAGLRVLAVASIDLAHVGPVFGDPFAVRGPRREEVMRSDRQLMAAVNEGDHAHLYEQIAAAGDRYRICGLSSLYLMLRYLDDAQGHEIAYAHCPADEEEMSFVSICGLLLE